MAKIDPIVISSIFDGISPTQFFGSRNSYDSSIAIDPDAPISSSDVKTSGAIVPVAYTDFSSTALNAKPLWVVTNPKDTKIYVILNNGRLLSYTSALGSETNVNSPSTSSGNGGGYYNNYLYYARNTDIGRYGPLDGSPAADDDAWTSSVLGSQTALTDTTYPTLRGVEMPNHPMHVHVDNQLYVGDVVDGAGVIHAIKTKKTTDEGDTNNGSQFNVLDLPFGFYPSDIESFGNDIVVSAFQTTDGTTAQGRSALFFWDTTSDSFYNVVYLPDPLVTALLNVNGTLYVWTGSASGGVRLSSFNGLGTNTLTYQEEGVPPFAGAVDSLADKITWGGYVTYPEEAAVVFALGSKSGVLPRGLHCVARSTVSGTNRSVTALKYALQDTNTTPKMIIGGSDNTAESLDKYDATATYDSIWRSQTYKIGRPGKVTKIRIPLAQAVAANMTLTVKVYTDDFSSSKTLTVVNNTNYSNSERHIEFGSPGASFSNNLNIELAWTGTAQLPVSFPIIVELEANK